MKDIHWEELVRAAFLGADRHGQPEGLTEYLKAQGLPWENLPPEQALLSAAALLHPLRRSALELPVFEGPWPEPPAAQPSSWCGPRSAHHLGLILKGEFRQALPEFLQHLLAAGKSLPPESLPALFQQSLSDAELWEQLAPAIGPQGHRLLRQNPNWSPLQAEADPARWQIAPRKERLAVLRQVRRRDPKGSLALLQSTWAKESSDDKLDFLLAFEGNVQAADEVFLEERLNERRKDVRLLAARLLAQVPDSALNQRLREIAGSFIGMEGDSLNISLPKTFNPSWQRDGIQEKSPFEFKGTAAIGWLLQFLALIPPHHWVVAFKQTPAACLRLFLRSKLGEPALDALAHSAVLHRDQPWMEAIMKTCIDQPGLASWKTEAAEKLMQQLSAESFGRLLHHALDQGRNLVEPHSPAARMLLTAECPWPETAALRLIEGFRNTLSAVDDFFWNVWHYKPILSRAAYHCPESLLESLQRSWPRQSRIWPRWETDVDDFLRTLYFRRQMIRALASNT